MQEIRRDIYLNELVSRRENGSIKIITGIRRCGKSYLLFNLYYDWLCAQGVCPSHIIRLALDDGEHDDLLEGKALSSYVKAQTDTHHIWYVFLDEIQLVNNFEKALNSLNRLPNLDIYVTGSNSRFLSSDILTEFRGRGDEVRVHPLCFAEYVPAHGGSQQDAWNDYFTYGGMPLILTRKGDAQKAKYLTDLLRKVYISDIVERNRVQSVDVLDALVNMLASAVGSLTNPTRLAKAFASKGVRSVSDKTLASYLAHLQDAFLISRAERYDIKGKRYIASPCKYYFDDVGLRNARLNFRQQEENHIMENIIYNELLVRGYNVDVGIVEHSIANSNGSTRRTQLEVDFVCNQGSQRYYIQSAFAIPDEAKMEQEQRSLLHIRDSFKKIIVVRDTIKRWRNEHGIVIMGIQDFLGDAKSLEME